MVKHCGSIESGCDNPLDCLCTSEAYATSRPTFYIRAKKGSEPDPCFLCEAGVPFSKPKHTIRNTSRTASIGVPCGGSDGCFICELLKANPREKIEYIEEGGRQEC